MALRNDELDEAHSFYSELEAAEPENPVWPQRCAEIHHRQGKPELEISALQRAADVAIDAGEIILGIALCKQVLEIDADHVETLDRIQLLYSSTPMDESSSTEDLESERSSVDSPSHAPLEAVMLTEMMPGATPDISINPELSGIAEIPLAETSPLDSPRQAKSGEPTAEAREQLSRAPLFGSLDPDSLRRLITRVQLVQLKEGEVLFRQGDPAEILYVVADGAVVPIAEEGNRKKLAVLESGSFFGEIALMTNAPRNATIEAIVDTLLLAIDRATMWELIKERPEVLKVMIGFLRDRLVDRLMRTNPLFLAFPARQRPAMAKLFRFLEVRSGTPLIEQGQPAQNLFALLAGTAEVIQMGIDSDKVVAELDPGSIFGEMSLLNQAPAMAAVVTNTKCWVLALSRRRLMRLIARNPDAEAIITRISNSREAENAQRSVSPIAALDGEADGKA